MTAQPLEPLPTIGRIVHYQSYGTPGGEYLPEPRAALITEIAGHVESRRVGLCVLNPTGIFFKQLVPYANEPTPGHWSWPPRAQEPWQPAVTSDLPTRFRLVERDRLIHGIVPVYEEEDIRNGVELLLRDYKLVGTAIVNLSNGKHDYVFPIAAEVMMSRGRITVDTRGLVYPEIHMVGGESPRYEFGSLNWEAL